MKNNTSGQLAEFMAKWFLRLKGYRIVAHNVVVGKGTHSGEIDLIARRGKTLVFVEVKKRSSQERAAYAIKPTQQQRIQNGAMVFLKKNPQFNGFDIRFDAILITFPCTIVHIENAW